MILGGCISFGAWCYLLVLLRSYGGINSPWDGCCPCLGLDECMGHVPCGCMGIN
jgi:hypothetical protein